MRKYLLFLAALASMAGAEQMSVFEMPKASADHVRLLAIMGKAHTESNYVDMAIASMDGVRLGTDDSLWYYNLACARALQKRADEAFAALDKAIAAGFSDAKMLREDSDFAAVRGDARFAKTLGRLEKLPPKPPFPCMVPNASRFVRQNATNTVWNFSQDAFQSVVDPGETTPTNRYAGPESERINRWAGEGSATPFMPVLYANRNNDAWHPAVEDFPSLLLLDYDPEMVSHEQHAGLPNTFFMQANARGFLPVVGSSSLRFINELFSESMPLLCCSENVFLYRNTSLFLANQLFFYSVKEDFAETGDRFFANLPVCIPVAGGTGSEQPFVGAALAALSAMRPAVRERLTADGMLAPALAMLFRASQRSVAKPADYLTARAHPAAFASRNLDVARLVTMAHGLTEEFPPPTGLQLIREPRVTPFIDFFEDSFQDEGICNSPFCIARIFRGVPFVRTYTLKATHVEPGCKLYWALLQGDPARVRLAEDPKDPTVLNVTVAWHPSMPVESPSEPGKVIRSSRVDIAAITGRGPFYSVPAMFSVYFIPGETRVYGDDGLIRSIDYTRPQPGCSQIPVLSQRKNWKDVYSYTPDKVPLGWTRVRGLQSESFSVHGLKVITRDSLGRPLRARRIRYQPRLLRLGGDDDASKPSLVLTDLAEVDDDDNLTYTYASDKDVIGQPSEPAAR
jgi:hypothetical protein